MDVDAITKKLEGEGYTHVFLWEDAPNTHHPYHEHHHDTAHVVVSGSIEVETENGKKNTYRAGDRFDVDAGIQHYAVAGQEGCIYLIGQRQ